jgi:hypothetical protein
MKFTLQNALILSVTCGILLIGCSSDAPTQGKGVTAQQLSNDIDKQLDKLAALPPEGRVQAHKMLDKPISKGSKAQQDRYKELMK